jgi:phosphoribosyl 1,2-cyclic phosphate phosphodiesterase
LGYRIGSLGYITDCTKIHERDLPKLKGIDTLIIDALRWTEHPTHYSVAQAMVIVEHLKPRQTFFTHMSHDMGLHADFERRLSQELSKLFPQELLDTVHLAYDQQEIIVNC